MLLSVEHSLVSCAQDALAFYSDTILEYLEISEENTLLCGISFGDEDEPSGTEWLRYFLQLKAEGYLSTPLTIVFS